MTSFTKIFVGSNKEERLNDSIDTLPFYDRNFTLYFKSRIGQNLLFLEQRQRCSIHGRLSVSPVNISRIYVKRSVKIKLSPNFDKDKLLTNADLLHFVKSTITSFKVFIIVF